MLLPPLRRLTSRHTNPTHHCPAGAPLLARLEMLLACGGSLTSRHTNSPSLPDGQVSRVGPPGRPSPPPVQAPHNNLSIAGAGASRPPSRTDLSTFVFTHPSYPPLPGLSLTHHWHPHPAGRQEPVFRLGGGTPGRPVVVRRLQSEGPRLDRCVGPPRNASSVCRIPHMQNPAHQPSLPPGRCVGPPGCTF